MIFLVKLYITYVRPILENCSAIWSPLLQRDIDLIESVQKRFTKFLPGMYDFNYVDRLRILNLESLEVRRIKADLILTYKICHRLTDYPLQNIFSINRNKTRGHKFKFNFNYCRTSCSKHFLKIVLFLFGII